MLFAWLRRRRRTKILSEPFPPEWGTILDAIPHVAALPAEQRAAHQNATQIFLAETSFEGCRDFTVTDPMRVTIAGLASVLVLGMPEFYFDNVQTILLYPDAFAVPKKTHLAPELELEEEDEPHLGEAHYRGPVILSWAEIEEDVREPWTGRNLVFHEFAHQLDMLTGEANGVPKLPADLREPWAKVMHEEYRRLQRTSRRRKGTLIDPYGANEPAEFFAVITETFFDAGRELAEERPQLYDVLRRYYNQDPARWEY